MDRKTLNAVVSQIHKRYPEFSGSQPKVSPRTSAGTKSNQASPTYLLTFSSNETVQSSTGKKTLTRWVRVVVNEQGKILKITTSR